MTTPELTHAQQAALRDRLHIARIQTIGVATALVNHWRSPARRAKGGARSHRFYMDALAEALDAMDALESELLGEDVEQAARKESNP